MSVEFQYFMLMTNYYNSSYRALDNDILGPDVALSLMSLDLKAERVVKCHGERVRVEHIISLGH